MRLENSFTVSAQPERVWALLTDVPAVVPCMPGAELVEEVDETTSKANVKVKLGPISMTFGATVRREEADVDAMRLRLVADARELRGRGMARATIAAAVQPSDGGSRVDVLTNLDLSGAVAQYGRGIVKDLAGQLTAEFAENLRGRLDGAADERAATQPVSGIRLLIRALRARFRRGADELPPSAGRGA